jgi:hypothetical protein
MAQCVAGRRGVEDQGGLRMQQPAQQPPVHQFQRRGSRPAVIAYMAVTAVYIHYLGDGGGFRKGMQMLAKPIYL